MGKTKAKLGDTVRVHYTGRLADGTVFDWSRDREPLEFTIGKGKVIPGLEMAVIGMDPGQEKTETVPADNAYGQRREDLVFEIDRERLPDELELEFGQQLAVETSDGQRLRVTVTDITASNITLDANHPLAGRDLIFDIELIEVC